MLPGGRRPLAVRVSRQGSNRPSADWCLSIPSHRGWTISLQKNKQQKTVVAEKTGWSISLQKQHAAKDPSG